MPLEGHAPDCACCVVRINAPNKRKRTGEDANLFDFLPPEDAPVECEEEVEEEEGEEEEEAQSIDQLISNALFAKFEQHVRAIEDARAARQELLSFKSALEDEGHAAKVSADASLDERDMLGVRMPGDNFQGDTNMRTLQKLLTRVDQRGFERSSQQLEFHEAFLKAAARIIYRGDWETEKPAIMRQHGWETSNSEVLISTPRRFGVRACCPFTRCALRVAHVRCRTLRRKRSVSRSSARVSRSPSAWRSLSSRQPDALPASSSSALSNLSSCPAERSASASTTRRARMPRVPTSQPLTPGCGVRAGSLSIERVRWSQEPDSLVPIQSWGACHRLLEPA